MGKKLHAEQELVNAINKFALKVVKNNKTVSPCNQCCRTFMKRLFDWCIFCILLVFQEMQCRRKVAVTSALSPLRNLEAKQ